MVEFATPLSGDEDRVDVYHDDEPLCKAEYIATATAATQALWLSRLLWELLGREVDVVELKVDNKSALTLAKNPIFHNRSKHIRINTISSETVWKMEASRPTTSPLLITLQTYSLSPWARPSFRR